MRPSQFLLIATSFSHLRISHLSSVTLPNAQCLVLSGTTAAIAPILSSACGVRARIDASTWKHTRCHSLMDNATRGLHLAQEVLSIEFVKLVSNLFEAFAFRFLFGVSESVVCEEHKTCGECQRDPGCGWLADDSKTGLGLCIRGTSTGPLEPKPENSTWYFIDCPGKF